MTLGMGSGVGWRGYIASERASVVDFNAHLICMEEPQGSISCSFA